MSSRIDELEKVIPEYAKKYYEGISEISDNEFDSLVEELKLLDPSSKILSVGWGYNTDGTKDVKHQFGIVGSLSKVKNPDNIDKSKEYIISTKIDGISCVAYYENGKVYLAATRGNGVTGKDITDKFIMINGSEINDKSFSGAVRGELAISNSSWSEISDKYADKYKDPRNLSAGIIARNEIDDDINYIDFVAYKVFGQTDGDQFFSTFDEKRWIMNQFDHFAIYHKINNSSININYLTEIYKNMSIPYPSDGIVFTNNEYSIKDNGFYDYDEIAFKFASESINSEVIDIEWNLTRTQCIKPVVKISPVDLSGATISRVTAFNAKYVIDNKIGKGSVVEVTRSNEVIPYINKVVKESDNLDIPKLCPVCGLDLVIDGADLKCKNTECNNLDSSTLNSWIFNLSPLKGVGSNTIWKYLDDNNISSIDDIYSDKVNLDYLSNSSKVTENKLGVVFNKLINDKKCDKTNFLVACNIPGLSWKSADSIVSNKLFDILLDKNDNLEKLYSINGIGGSLVKNIKKYQDRIINYSKYVIFNADKSIDDTPKRQIAVTGTLSIPRSSFAEKISNYGFELTTNINKSEFLVTNSPDSNSSKARRAKEVGCKIITENEFTSKFIK